MIKNRSVLMAALASCALALAAGAQEFPVVLFPFREATIASALDSELKDYPYTLGEAFTNGAVVAELDDARYRVAFLRAKEHRDFTVRAAKEQRELRKKDFASEMELRKAEYEAKIAEADFDEAKLNLSHCRFIAPFNGKIAEFLTQRYETVKPGQPLFRIIEDDRLLAVANLPMGKVKVGEETMIVPDGLASVTGRVYEVAPQADNRTGTVRVRILVENPKGALTAGMTGMLRLIEAPVCVVREPVATTEPSAPTIPDGPLVFDSPGTRYASVTEAFKGTSSVSNSQDAIAFEIVGIKYLDGVLAYELRCNPAAISITSLKRVGELTAGVYDGEGNRLACLDPQQIELPKVGLTVTNILPFAAAVRADTSRCKRPIKLVVRLERDVRAIVLEEERKEDGGR